jgi:predicted transcriptional regulator
MPATLSTRRVRREAMTTDIDAARQGLLKFIAKKGGSIPIRDLHTHSLVFYQAGHQAFSQLMEGLVADDYVTFDDGDGAFRLTDKGRAFLEQDQNSALFADRQQAVTRPGRAPRRADGVRAAPALAIVER